MLFAYSILMMQCFDVSVVSIFLLRVWLALFPGLWFCWLSKTIVWTLFLLHSFLKAVEQFLHWHLCVALNILMASCHSALFCLDILLAVAFLQLIVDAVGEEARYWIWKTALKTGATQIFDSRNLSKVSRRLILVFSCSKDQRRNFPQQLMS